MSGSMPCGNTAALRQHEREVAEASERAERLEREFDRDHAADKKLEILDSIGQPDDPCDFGDFMVDHRFALVLAFDAIYHARPDLKPANYDDACSVVAGTRVAELLDEFVKDRLEAVKGSWVNKEMSRPDEPPDNYGDDL